MYFYFNVYTCYGVFMKLNDPYGQMFTISKAAKVLGVDVQTLRYWADKKKIPYKRHPINNYRLFDRKVIFELSEKINGGK